MTGQRISILCLGRWKYHFFRSPTLCSVDYEKKYACLYETFQKEKTTTTVFSRSLSLKLPEMNLYVESQSRSFAIQILPASNPVFRTSPTTFVLVVRVLSLNDSVTIHQFIDEIGFSGVTNQQTFVKKTVAENPKHVFTLIKSEIKMTLIS